MDFGVAVDLAGRGDEEAGALPLRDPEHVVGAVGADFERVQRQPQVVDRARRRGEVVDEVDVLGDVDVGGDVDVTEVERLVTDVGDVLQRPGLEVVEADHPVPVAEQPLAEMGPEEAGAAGDYAGAHGAILSSPGPPGRSSDRSAISVLSGWGIRPGGGRVLPRSYLALPVSRNRIRSGRGNRSSGDHRRGGDEPLLEGDDDAARKRAAVESTRATRRN